MQKTFYLILSLLCAVVQVAWAQFGGGDGSAKNPYIISTTAHWNQFATDVNGGNTYSDKYFLLNADISVTATVGTGTTGNNAKTFNGTFDGGGHTLIFSYDGSGDDIAPFRFVKNAFISNLHVAGEIKTSGRHAGGLAGRTYGTTQIVNCRVSTVINSSHEGDGTHGGIVALKPDWSNAHLTIEGCVYDGKILSTGTDTEATTDCGGFVGYTSYGSLTIKNSIYAPTAPDEDETAVNSHNTFYRYNAKHPGTITLDKCYYTQMIGNDATQGIQALSMGFPAGFDFTVVPNGEATEYSVSGITVYEGNPCMKYDGTVYAGSGDNVTLTFTHNYVGCNVTGYGVAEGNAKMTKNDTGDYTLKMGSTNVVFGFSMNGPPLYFLEGNGTSASPYIINSGGVWDYIVSLVNYGEKYVSGTDDQNNNIYSEYATAYYKLTEDITVTTMMGSESHRFKGHIDGGIYDENHNLVGHHTLTVNYDTDEQYTAPFRYVEDAEISNLRVAGTITTSKKFAAGFVANAKGNNTMTNCRSSVTINSSVNGDGSHGGFVAHNLSGRFNMEGCSFDGQMLGSKTNNCGGFVGWNETNGSSEGIVVFRNCFFAPTSTTMGIERTYARSRTNDGGHVQMYYSNCRTDFGDNQQFRVYSISAGDDVTVAANETEEKTYNVSGITIYDTGMMYDGVIYAREGQTMGLTLGYTGTVPVGSSFGGFSTSSGTLSGDSNPFGLKMGKGDAIINAIISGGTSGWTHDGSGTSESPYIISNADEWNEFVDKVNNSVYGFNTAYYQLADDITVTTMVGTEGYKFKGHFDGNGKTLTLSYGSAASPFSEDYCAPFRYIEGAYIHDLIVDGTIYTQNQFAAGIAGYALNNNAITDCLSSVVINSSYEGDGTHGGFVANCQNNADDETCVTFTRCAFDGKLLGTVTNNWGGFVGWTEGSDWAGVKFIDCIFAPSAISVDTDGCATFSRGRADNRDRITIDNSYYIQSLGSMQGEMGYTQQPTNITYVTMTSAGVTVYVKKTFVTNVAATDITPTQATISWKGTDACSNYQVRYRVKKNLELYSTDFEDGMPEGWTTFDNDGDNEYSWSYNDGTKKGMTHSGDGCMYSASYINNYGALEPDNWLVSPQVDLGGTMKVWLKGQDEDDYREHFAVYLSTAGNQKSNFLDEYGNLLSTVITLVPETETTNEYQEYTADLSTYSGQGYIAIRHFNCYDQFYLVLDDFSIYDDNAGGAWTVASGGSPAGTTLTGLTPNTTYEYQVGYDFNDNTFYTSTATLSTLAADVAPTDLTATAITANTATISWKGYGTSYNLRYSKGGVANVTLSVPSDVWDDGSGYQMLLDADHNTYGSVIPETGGLTNSGNASPETYANFEYKIPTNADGGLGTDKIVDGSKDNKSVTITIPAGIYDWCITNPSPNDRVWIASGNGNVGGRQDDFTFEAGKHYTFTVTLDNNIGNDCVNMTVEDDAELAQGYVTEIKDITATSYNMSSLTASTSYTVYVQSVKGEGEDEKTSEWSSVNFNTLDAGELYLYDDQDNSGIIADNNGQRFNVTLQGRTLYKDGSWNTLCLPFPVALEGSPLENADVRELSSTIETEGVKTGLNNGVLTLNFTAENGVTELVAGKPYIIKWTKADGYDQASEEERDIKNPVFKNVTIDKTAHNFTNTDGKVVFKGSYAAQIFTSMNTSILFLGAENTLYYPMSGATIGACRAFFEITDGTPVRAFNLNFGDEATGVTTPSALCGEAVDEAWYTLDGRRLSGKPVKRGIYINNGNKTVIK